ncbi:hypothetical protein HAX54_023802, partial [Datura stramonium]|nr:hypothetical protein [Datura stramonium]
MDQCDRILIVVCRYERLVPEVSIRTSVMREFIDSDVMKVCVRHITAGMIDFRLILVEVHLGVAFIQRKLLHSSVDGFVSFIYRCSDVELLYLFRLYLGKNCISWE